MRRRSTRLRSLTAVALLAGVATAPALDPAPGTLTDAELERLESGEVVIHTRDLPGYSLPHVTARGIIEAPPEQVWALLDRCDDYERTMPRVQESEELSREGNVVRCRAIYDMPWPLQDLECESEATLTTAPGLYRREWELVSGELEVHRGSWTLRERNDGQATLATYEALNEPKTSIPDFVVRLGLSVTIHRLFESLREQTR